MQGDDYNVGKIYFGIKIPRGTEFVKNEHPHIFIRQKGFGRVS